MNVNQYFINSLIWAINDKIAFTIPTTAGFTTCELAWMIGSV